MTRRTIALHGPAYGRNFGDVLILKQLAEELTRRTGAFVRLPFAAPRFNKDYKPERRWFWEREHLVAAVWGPGGYMGERPFQVEAWVKRLLSYHGQFWNFLVERGLPSAIFGVGVGPLKDLNARRFILDIFERAEIAFVRDEESYQYLKDYGATMAHIDIAPDIAMSLSASSLDQQRLANLRAGLLAGRYEKAIGLHVPDIAVQESEGWTKFASDLEVLVDRHPTSRFVLFRDGPYKTDGPAPKIALALAKKQNILLCPYDGPEALIYRMAVLDSVVTTKLHVGICSYGLGNIPVSVFIHTKVPRFYKQIGFPQLSEPIHEYRSGWVFDALEISLANRSGSNPLRNELKSKLQTAIGRLTDVVAPYC